MIRKKRGKEICLILTIIMILSGIYGECFKIDSLFEYQYTEEADAIAARDTNVTESKLCTTEMIQGSNVYYEQRVANKYEGQRKELKLSHDMVCANIYLAEPGKSVVVFETMYWNYECVEELMISYVHEADGKKRV